MNKAMIRIAAALIVAAALVPAAPACAQKTQRIAAIVNDDIVSVFDLKERMQMVIFSSGLPQNRQVTNRLAPQVLRGLIDERIRLQEAKRRNVSVTKSDLRRVTTDLEKRNKVPPGMLKDFLTKNGVSIDTVLSQIRARIAWSKLINRRFRSRVTISDEEIDEALERRKARQGETQYRIAEIYLAIDNPDREPDVRRGGQRLVEQLRAGANFSSVARQFSQSSSAAAGGDLGWIFEADLDDGLRAVVSKLKPGRIAEPLVDASGVRIVMLIAKRKAAAPDPADVKLTLRQIFLPVPQGVPSQEADSQLAFARSLGAGMSGCADIDTVAKEVNAPGSTDLGKFRLADLSPDIRAAVADLPIGKASAPVLARGGVLLLMVCERNQPQVKLPTRKDIEDLLIAQRLSRMERRYMRDLRNASVVDLRI